MKRWSISRRTLGNAGFVRYFSRNNTPETVHNCSVVYCWRLLWLPVEQSNGC